MKKVQRVETERSHPAEVGDSSDVNALGSDAASDFQNNPEASVVQPGEEQKPLVLSTKKEPPIYPPGETGHCKTHCDRMETIKLKQLSSGQPNNIT